MRADVKDVTPSLIGLDLAQQSLLPLPKILLIQQ